MLRPDKDYFRYRTDDTIILQKLPTETPRSETILAYGSGKNAGRCICGSINQRKFSESEISMIYEDSFSEYALDEDRLFRYARRRGSEELREYISKETEISLIEVDIDRYMEIGDKISD